MRLLVRSAVNRGALITRKVILLALALTSVPADTGPAWPVAVFGLAVGAAFAFLIMESRLSVRISIS